MKGGRNTTMINDNWWKTGNSFILKQKFPLHYQFSIETFNGKSLKLTARYWCTIFKLHYLKGSQTKTCTGSIANKVF